MKKVIRMIGNMLMILLLFIAGCLLYSVLQAKKDPGEIPSILGFHMMTVLTGSMSPALEPGDMVFVKQADAESLKENDIVTFRQTENRFVTHRITEKREAGGELSFATKGDANNQLDQSLLAPDQIVGKVEFSIPKIGLAADFLRSMEGMVSLLALGLSAVFLTRYGKSTSKQEIHRKGRARGMNQELKGGDEKAAR